jgi:hypothetical protein
LTKKYFSHIILYLLLVSCGVKESDNDIKPVYFNTVNDWDKYNIYGDVQNIEHYTINENSNKKTKNTSFKFSKSGMLEAMIEFDKNGEILSDQYFKYDAENRVIWNKINKRNRNTYLLYREAYDTLNHDHVYYVSGTRFNDSISYTVYCEHDNQNNIVKDSLVEQDGTNKVTKFILDYNKNGHIESSIILQSDSILIEKMKRTFNSNKILKETTESNQDTIMIKFFWQNDALISEKHFRIKKIRDTVLNKIIKYNSLYNPIEINYYNDSELMKSDKYEYKYDKFGNWTKMTVDIKTEDSILKNVYLREIEYW